MTQKHFLRSHRLDDDDNICRPELERYESTAIKVCRESSMDCERQIFSSVTDSTATLRKAFIESNRFVFNIRKNVFLRILGFLS